MASRDKANLARARRATKSPHAIAATKLPHVIELYNIELCIIELCVAASRSRNKRKNSPACMAPTAQK